MCLQCGLFLSLVMSAFFFTKISLHLTERKKERAELSNPSCDDDDGERLDGFSRSLSAVFSAVESIETELRLSRLVDCTNIERRVRRKGKGSKKTFEATIEPQARMKSKANWRAIMLAPTVMNHVECTCFSLFSIRHSSLELSICLSHLTSVPARHAHTHPDAAMFIFLFSPWCDHLHRQSSDKFLLHWSNFSSICMTFADGESQTEHHQRKLTRTCVEMPVDGGVAVVSVR